MYQVAPCAYGVSIWRSMNSGTPDSSAPALGVGRNQPVDGGSDERPFLSHRRRSACMARVRHWPMHRRVAGRRGRRRRTQVAAGDRRDRHERDRRAGNGGASWVCQVAWTWSDVDRWGSGPGRAHSACGMSGMAAMPHAAGRPVLSSVANNLLLAPPMPCTAAPSSSRASRQFRLRCTDRLLREPYRLTNTGICPHLPLIAHDPHST